MRALNVTLSRMCGLAVVIVLSLAIPAAAMETLSNVKIKNFGRISDTYYRGAQPKGHDYTDLAALGIKTVINLTNGDGEANEKTMVENADMKYYQIPMTTHVVPTVVQLAEFLKIVNNPANEPVYVHCVGGRHRTGVMTAVYRMTQFQWTAAQAFKEMKQFDFGADFLHREFKNFVFDYFKQLASARTVPAVVQPAATAKAAS